MRRKSSGRAAGGHGDGGGSDDDGGDSTRAERLPPLKVRPSVDMSLVAVALMSVAHFETRLEGGAFAGAYDTGFTRSAMRMATPRAVFLMRGVCEALPFSGWAHGSFWSRWAKMVLFRRIAVKRLIGVGLKYYVGTTLVHRKGAACSLVGRWQAFRERW